MFASVGVDLVAAQRRSPATVPGYLSGRAPANKGMRYPADPPRVEEIIAVMRTCGTSAHGLRMRALIVVLWRARLRISEALALSETDLDVRRGSPVVRHGKGDKRREVGMDPWAWEHVQAWLDVRVGMPVGPLLCVVNGPSRGERGRPQPRAPSYGIWRSVPGCGGALLRHAHAVELAREGVPLNVIQRQLGHADLGITSVYLQGIDTSEIVDTLRARAAPTTSATAGLLL